MKHLSSVSSLSAFLLPLVSANTGSVTCNNIQVKKHKYDFSQLDKPNIVWVLDEDSPPAVYNTTWTVNICSQLKYDKSKEAEDQCKTGTNICGIRRSWNPVDDPDKKHIQVENVIPLAGHWMHESKPLEHWWTPIEANNDHPGGLEFKVDGAKYGKFKQRAFIDFQCDTSANEEEKRDDDDDDKPKQSEGDLRFLSYDLENDGKYSYETLRLQWKTKYACSDYKWDAGQASSGWGFFTWFILILFLGVAAYLIFGSWLNYNRYGARGWDLLPHGDTIRDIPYLVKDWGKKVVDTVSGPGTRGGYSAV